MADIQQPEEQINDIALIEQDKSTVAILQEDDLKTLKEAIDKVKTFKRKYTLKKLTVTDLESKEQKEKLRLALAELRTTRTTLGNDKKEKTLPYRNTVAYINANYDKVIEAIETVEKPLIAHNKKVKLDIEAKEKEEEIRKQQRVNERVQRLIDSKCHFDGNYYAIGSEEHNVPFITLGIVDLETMTDPIFENILVQVVEKAQFIVAETEKQQARIAEEKRLQQEKEAEERKAFLAQQEQLKKEQEALRKEREEMEQMRREMQEHRDKMEKQRLDEEKRVVQEAHIQRKALINSRYDQLVALGMKLNGQYGCYVYEDVNVDNATEICLLNEAEWHTLVEKITPVIAERKAAAQLKADEAKKAEEKRISDKAIADKKIADDLLEKNRIEALNKEGDNALWVDYISRLKSVSWPEVKSNDYQIKVNDVRKYMESLN